VFDSSETRRECSGIYLSRSLACDSRGVGAGFVLLRPGDGISGEGGGGKAAMKLVDGSDVNHSARAKGIES